jgi:hypothetical protein
LRKIALNLNETPPNSDGQSEFPQVVKYYQTRQMPEQFLGKAVPYAIARDGAYFKATYAADGRLLSLEYCNEQTSKSSPPAPKIKLTSSRATVWDLIFNRPLYYVDAEGNRFPSRAIVLRDSTRLIRFVDYLNEAGTR